MSTTVGVRAGKNICLPSAVDSLVAAAKGPKGCDWQSCAFKRVLSANHHCVLPKTEDFTDDPYPTA